jgi:ribosomal protein S18 acetylase RimI-like enzyme
MRCKTGPVTAAVELGPADAGEVLTLQRAAYVTEARLHDDLSLPALHQPADDLRAELGDPTVLALGVRDDGGRLLAAVRARVDGAAAHVGRLAVVPDRQGQGLGSGLLTALEEALPREVAELRLFTGERSAANLRLYARLGYRETGRTPTPAGYALVHLAKSRTRA